MKNQKLVATAVFVAAIGIVLAIVLDRWWAILPLAALLWAILDRILPAAKDRRRAKKLEARRDVG